MAKHKDIYTALFECKFDTISMEGQNARFASTKGGGKYMKVEDILQSVVPVLREQGIMVIGRMKNQDSMPVLCIELRHVESGTSIESESVCVDDTKNGSQQIGSGITYMTRYMLQRLLNLAPDASTDDDGNDSSSKNKKSGFTPKRNQGGDW